MQKSVLAELEAWYEGECDGLWEHRYGVRIGNVDNPGWIVSINLVDTDLEERPFIAVKENFDDPRTFGVGWM